MVLFNTQQNIIFLVQPKCDEFINSSRLIIMERGNADLIKLFCKEIIIRGMRQLKQYF